jgi:hypothetical protein
MSTKACNTATRIFSWRGSSTRENGRGERSSCTAVSQGGHFGPVHSTLRSRYCNLIPRIRTDPVEECVAPLCSPWKILHPFPSYFTTPETHLRSIVHQFHKRGQIDVVIVLATVNLSKNGDEEKRVAFSMWLVVQEWRDVEYMNPSDHVPAQRSDTVCQTRLLAKVVFHVHPAPETAATEGKGIYRR